MSLIRQLTKSATAALAAVAVLASCSQGTPVPKTTPSAVVPSGGRAEIIDSWSADEQPAFAQRATSRWRVRSRGSLGSRADIVRADGSLVLRHTVGDRDRRIEDVFLIGDTALVVETTRMELIEQGRRDFAPKRVVRYRLPATRPEVVGREIPVPSPSSPWAAGPSHAAYLHEDTERRRVCVVTLDSALTARTIGCAPRDWGIQALQVGARAITWQQGSRTCAQAWGALLTTGRPRPYGAPDRSGCGEWESVESAGGRVWSEVDKEAIEHSALFARDSDDRRPLELGTGFTGTLVSCGGWAWWRAASSYAPELSLQLRRWRPGSKVETVFTTPKPDGMVMSRPECGGDSLTFEVGDTATNRFQLLRIGL